MRGDLRRSRAREAQQLHLGAEAPENGSQSLQAPEEGWAETRARLALQHRREQRAVLSLLSSTGPLPEERLLEEYANHPELPPLADDAFMEILLALADVGRVRILVSGLWEVNPEISPL